MKSVGELLENMRDLGKQARTEKSHYYVAKTLAEASMKIEEMRAALLECRAEFCWHGNTGNKLSADMYAQFVDRIDEILGDE